MSETHFALSLVLGGGPRYVRGFTPSFDVGFITQSVFLVPHFGSHCVQVKYFCVFICSCLLFFVLEALGGGRVTFYFIII